MLTTRSRLLSVVAAIAAALLSVSAPILASPFVRAEVTWRGNCEDRGRLETELRNRGVELLHVAGYDDPTNRLQLAVTVQTDVGERNSRIVAQLDLEDARGGRETRSVEVQRCDELHCAIAVILVVFAQSKQAKNPNEVANAESAQLPAPTTAPPSNQTPAERQVLAAELHPTEVVPPASQRPRAPRSPSRVSVTRTDTFRVSSPKRSNFGELVLGAAVISSYGWVKAATSGATVHLEWRPSSDSPIAIRASYVDLGLLATESREGAIPVESKRRFGRLAAKVTTPFAPLGLLFGAEAGVASARGVGLENNEFGSAAWFALVLQPMLDVPLYKRILTAQFSTGLAVVPTQFVLEYRDTGGVAARMNQFEWRAELGLGVQLAPTFP